MHPPAACTSVKIEKAPRASVTVTPAASNTFHITDFRIASPPFMKGPGHTFRASEPLPVAANIRQGGTIRGKRIDSPRQCCIFPATAPRPCGRAPMLARLVVLLSFASWTHGRCAPHAITGFSDFSDAIGWPIEFLPLTPEERDYNARHAGDNCEEPPCNVSYGLCPGALDTWRTDPP